MSDRIRIRDEARAAVIAHMNDLIQRGDLKATGEDIARWLTENPSFRAFLRVDRDALLDVDPMRRLKWWDHDIDESESGLQGQPTLDDDTREVGYVEGGESLGDGSWWIRPVRYD
jgi:hypothetical protein